MALMKNLKLNPDYYGPHLMLQRIGKLVYKLELLNVCKAKLA
jgi:hypothetical protein